MEPGFQEWRFDSYKLIRKENLTKIHYSQLASIVILQDAAHAKCVRPSRNHSKLRRSHHIIIRPHILSSHLLHLTFWEYELGGTTALESVLVQPRPLVGQRDHEGDTNESNADGESGFDTSHVRNQDSWNLLGREHGANLRSASYDDLQRVDVGGGDRQLVQHDVDKGGLTGCDREGATNGLEDCTAHMLARGRRRWQGIERGTHRERWR